MLFTEKIGASPWRIGCSRAAEPTSHSALKSTHCGHRKLFNVFSSKNTDRRCCLGHSSRAHAPQVTPSESQPSARGSRRPKASSSSLNRRDAARLGFEAEDPTFWLEDAAASNASQQVSPGPSASTTTISSSSSSSRASGPGCSILSGSSGPHSGAPLSPAAARALARGFRPGDLALASAGPLQVWCRTAAASRSRRTLQPPRAESELPHPHHRLHHQQHQYQQQQQRPPGANGACGAIGEAGQHDAAGAAGDSRDTDVDEDVDVVLLGPPGRPRDLSVLVAAVERLVRRPARRGCIGCVVVAPSRERVEALLEAAFALLAERGGGPEAMHVMAVHGGTRFREDVSGLRSQPPDLLLTTPGRLTELLTTEQVQLGYLFESLRVLVLDGGETLSSRAFRPQVERLLRRLPNTGLHTLTSRRPGAAPPTTNRLRPAAAPPPASAPPASPLAAATPRGGTRAVALVAAAEEAAAAATTSTPQASQPPPLPSAGSRGALPCSLVTPRPHTRASPAAAAAGDAAALRLRAANQLLAVQRSVQRSPAENPGEEPHRLPESPPNPDAAGGGGEVGATTAAAASSPILTGDLRSFVDLALRSGFATFRLGGGGGGGGGSDDGSAVSGSDAYGAGPDGVGDRVGARSLAAAVALTLGTSASGAGGGSEERRAATRGSLVSPVDPRSEVAAAAAAAASPASAASAASAIFVPAQPTAPPVADSAQASWAPPLQPPLVPLHVLAVPYEEHLPYLYVVVRQHMLSEGRHKIVVQFPSAHLANLYAKLFQALGFPAACAHSRLGRVGRQEAVRDFSAGMRGLLFCTDLMSGGLGELAGGNLTLAVWVGLPRRPSQLVQHMAAVQQAATAAAASVPPPQHASKRRALAPAPVAGSDAASAPAAHGVVSVAAARVAPAVRPTPVAASAIASGGEELADAPPPPPPPLPPRCLLLLHDVDSPRPVAMALAEALAAAGLGRVLPMQPGSGAWEGPLEAVSRRVRQVLAAKVPPEVKLRALEGLVGHLWVARGGGAGGGAGDGGGWQAVGAGLGPQPEQKLGVWARRFAESMGLPLPPLMSRHVAARMGLRSIPGVTLVDFHAGRPPPPGAVPPSPPPPPQQQQYAWQGQPLPRHLRFAWRQQRQLQQWQGQRQRQWQRQQQPDEEKERRRRLHEEQQKKAQEAKAERQLRHLQQQQQQAERKARKERPKLHPPSVIARFRWFRALKRTQKAQQDAGQDPPPHQQVQAQHGSRAQDTPAPGPASSGPQTP